MSKDTNKQSPHQSDNWIFLVNYSRTELAFSLRLYVVFSRCRAQRRQLFVGPATHRGNKKETVTTSHDRSFNFLVVVGDKFIL